MKKIFGFIALAAMVLSFAACSDDDTGEQYEHQTTVTVGESHLTFNAAAQTGYVTINAPGAITARTDASWAQAAVQGDSIAVTVTANHNLEGRSSVLTVFSGSDSTNVTVQQQGMEYKYTGDSYYFYNDSARTVDFPLTSVGAELSVETPDWVTATADDNGIHTSLSENTSGGIRTGEVYVHAGPYTDTIQVIQGELKDIINKPYYFVAYDLAQNIQSDNIDDYQIVESSYVLADTVDYAGQAYVIPYIYFPDNNWVMQFQFDEPDLMSILPGGIAIGTYARRYYLYTAIVDPSVYSALAQTDQSYPALMASDYMYMLGYWGSDDEVGNYSVFQPYSRNLNNWMGQLFSSLTSYNGYILGIFAFSNRLGSWVDDEGYVNTNNLGYYIGVLNFYALPELIEASTAASAKPTVLPIGKRYAKGHGAAKPSKTELQQALQYIKAAKAATPGQSAGNFNLNTKVGVSPTSPFDYMNKVVLNH